MTKSYAGRVAIITGGASGIGKALAQELSARGCRVVLADINRDTLDQTLSELNSETKLASGRVIDVKDANAVQALVQTTRDEFGKIDLMFNNAGVNICGEFRDVSLEDWNFVIDVNLRGV